MQDKRIWRKERPLKEKNIRGGKLFLRDNTLNENIEEVDERETLERNNCERDINFLKRGTYCIMKKILKLESTLQGNYFTGTILYNDT